MDNVSKKPTKSKQQLLLLVCAFVIPVLLAKLALTIGFKGEIKTHGGELLTVEKTYQQLIGEQGRVAPDKQWRVVYVSEQACDEHCMVGLYHIQQTYKALGRLQERVSIDLLNTNKAHASELDNKLSMDLFSHHVVSTVAMPSLNRKVVIVDPMGNLVMSYQFDGGAHEEQAHKNLIKAHDMLLDIKQLLKLSRIG